MRKVFFIAPTLLLALIFYSLYHFRRPIQPLPDVRHVEVTLNVQRLEKELFNLQDKAAIRIFLDSNPVFSTQFLGINNTKAQEALVEQLAKMIKDPHMQELYQETQQVFGDLSAIQERFESAFRYLKYYYPEFKIPQIATFITGMGTDLYISEDLIVIGLDFFMGKDAKFRPTHLPDYLLAGYQPAHVVPKTMLLLSQQFIQMDPEDTTLLADMVYYGKAYYLAQALLPHVTRNMLLAYTPEQLADVVLHQRTVWEHFVENELLYTTNHLVKNRYLSDRPFVAEIGPRCPGNIGRWLGWEIVASYMKQHTDVSLPTLMRNPNARELFRQSKYRPKN